MIQKAQPRVLIAEGDAPFSRLLCKFLSDEGYLAQSASEGTECLVKVREFSPDVLVLDMALPSGGGDGVLACLREAGPAPLPKVVLTATWETPGSFAELLVRPVAFCLLRPFSRTGLLNAIRRATGECLSSTLKEQAARRPEAVPM